jgi:hypothetical protein
MITGDGQQQFTRPLFKITMLRISNPTRENEIGGWRKINEEFYIV